MLQQTQVERVLPKYEAFIERFPDFSSLASARLGDVLRVWQGMGYNRRAKALKEIAGAVVRDHAGELPADEEVLQRLPGIGKATSSAIAAFAFGQSSALIETNIRRVFIHFFFPGRRRIKDSQILPLVKKTVDRADPRRWYYALMDYGVMLKKKHPDLLKKSSHYKKQSRFEGSDRQIRGAILRELTKAPSLSWAEMTKRTKTDLKRVKRNITALEKEGLVRRSGKKVCLP